MLGNPPFTILSVFFRWTQVDPRSLSLNSQQCQQSCSPIIEPFYCVAMCGLGDLSGHVHLPPLQDFYQGPPVVGEEKYGNGRVGKNRRPDLTLFIFLHITDKPPLHSCPPQSTALASGLSFPLMFNLSSTGMGWHCVAGAVLTHDVMYTGFYF